MNFWVCADDHCEESAGALELLSLSPDSANQTNDKKFGKKKKKTAAQSVKSGNSHQLQPWRAQCFLLPRLSKCVEPLWGIQSCFSAHDLDYFPKSEPYMSVLSEPLPMSLFVFSTGTTQFKPLILLCFLSTNCKNRNISGRLRAKVNGCLTEDVKVTRL